MNNCCKKIVSPPKKNINVKFQKKMKFFLDFFINFISPELRRTLLPYNDDWMNSTCPLIFF